MEHTMLKRGTRIEYTYAGGKIVPGRIVKSVNPEMMHGLQGWYQVRLTDEGGEYGGCVHVEQIRVTSNHAS